MRGGYYSYESRFIKHLPIIINSNSTSRHAHDSIIALVTQILAAKQHDPAADVAALEAEIDAHVYRLYELTAEEIAVVEESVRR